MIQESYDMLEKLVKEMQEKIIRTIYNLNIFEKDYAVIAKIQQSIIDFGSNIEQSFHIEESELIHNFQYCCELLYKYCKVETKHNEILNELSSKVSEWNEALKQSVEIIDRRLSIVAIVRNEGEYLREWIEYHFLSGVSHIYLYDNESTDDTKEILKDYMVKGLVTYIWWPGKAAQLPAYNHALENYRYDTYYMGFIDADEFLISVQNENLCEAIDAAFEMSTKRLKYIGGQCGGIGINWRMYGTSFHKEKPDGLVIENYKHRAVDTYIENGHIKTICNPRVAVSFDCNPHCLNYLNGYYCTSEDGAYIIPDAFFFDGMCINLRINHYYSKSEEELIKRLKKGKAKENDNKLNEEQISKRLQAVRDNFNIEFDPIMNKYIKKVKLCLQYHV